MIEMTSNRSTIGGYLAVPESGRGPGVIVIQEWWGLVPHITDVVDRFASAGFVALAPDLYHGQATTEPDEAGKLMMALNATHAAADISGTVDLLLAHEAVSGTQLGVVGFCMGGGLALIAASLRPDAIAACVPFYGLIPWEALKPDYTRITAKVRGHFAELDGFFGPDLARGLEADLRAHGIDASIEIHPGVEHAFFNDSRAEVYDTAASAAAWHSTIEFFRAELSSAI